jgi:hypothetical protein
MYNNNRYSLLYDQCDTQCSNNMKCTQSVLDNTKFFTPVYNNITPPITYITNSPISNNQQQQSNTEQCDCFSNPPTDVSNTKDPKVWGPHLWQYLHYSALNYNPRTEEDALQMKEWLKCLAITIPCKNCSNHYAAYINKFSDKELYDICCSKDDLFNLLVDIHNAVNKRNNKKAMSYTEAREIFKKK